MGKFIEVSPVYKEPGDIGLADKILVRSGHIDVISPVAEEDSRFGAKCVLIVHGGSIFSSGGSTMLVRESYPEIKRKLMWGGDAP